MTIGQTRHARFLAWWTIVAVVSAAFFATVVPSNAQPTNTATVTTALNLRNGPGTQHGVVFVLPAGARVSVFQCTTAQTWCELNYNGRIGWASARYLSFQSAVIQPAPQPQPGPAIPPGQVTAQTTNALNLRQGPNPNYAVILTIPAGATVSVNRCTAQYSWCEVYYGSTLGWVYARYIRSTQPQYGQQPVANIGAQLGLRLFEFIVGQLGGQTPALPPQQNAPGPNQVCFYRDYNFAGPSFCATVGQNEAQLGAERNDMISSIRVGFGAVVEVCSDFNYGGVCQVVSGDIVRLPDNVNDRISSYRTTQIGQPPQQAGRACFFADFNFQGAGFCLQSGQAITLLDGNWNDRISSIRLSPGVVIRVCRDASFGGWCEEYSANVPQLPVNRNDMISSIRVF